MNSILTESAPSQRTQSESSYKFQRLREKVRRAIESGELAGKLPGERALARRFHVNAKTLSKALTDLAAEGLLDRSIGRGTYVKGSQPAPAVTTGKWLVVCEAGEEDSGIVEHLRKQCPDLEAVSTIEQVRPSYLNQFCAVVNLAEATPEAFLRQLLVRNMPVVSANHEPKAYSMHAIVPDLVLGITRLARDLMLAGHRKLGAVEPRGSTSVSQALRQAAARYAPETLIETAEAAEAADLVRTGATALVCGSSNGARKTRATLDKHGITVPGRVSLAAVGCSSPDAACSGYFVDCGKISEGIVNLLKDAIPRPVTLWIPGTWVDRGTIAPTGSALPFEEPPPLQISGVVV